MIPFDTIIVPDATKDIIAALDAARLAIVAAIQAKFP
jgi:hypothetical protein